MELPPVLRPVRRRSVDGRTNLSSSSPGKCCSNAGFLYLGFGNAAAVLPLAKNRAVASRGYGSTRAVERTGWSPVDFVGIRAEEAPVNSLRVVGRLQRDSAAPIGFGQG